jgi:hypothetical protein
MKILSGIFFLLLLCGIPAFGQIVLPSRDIQVKFLENKRQLLWTDLREGLLMPCDSLAVLREDSLHVNILDRLWLIRSEMLDVGIVILMPPGQNKDNWEEMMLIQRVDARGMSAKQFHKRVLKIKEERCPKKTYYSKVIKESARSVLYESKSDHCERYDADSSIKIILSPPVLSADQHTLWIIEYTRKSTDFDATYRATLHQWLSSLKLLTGTELLNYNKKSL